jgi:hypothetical protein
MREAPFSSNNNLCNSNKIIYSNKNNYNSKFFKDYNGKRNNISIGDKTNNYSNTKTSNNISYGNSVVITS